MFSPISFRLAGSGVHLPGARTVAPGIERPRVAAGETSSAMAAGAAAAAIEDAGWRASGLGAIVGGCSVMEQPIPGTAIMVQRRLGLGASGIPTFDVNATCLSGLLALDLALAGVASGRWPRALAFAADIASAAIDETDAALAAIFGDGAAAVAVEAGGPHRLLASRFESYGDHADLCALEAGGTRLDPRGEREAFLAAARFRMAGPALYRATARLFPGFLERLLGEAGVAAADLDCIVPHQASGPALRHLRAAVGGPAGRYVDVFARYGNQVATSVLHALHVARRDGRLAPGTTTLIVGSAAGISLGGMVVRW